MNNLLKVLGLMALFGMLMMAGGCGGGGDEIPVVTNPSVTASFAATVNSDGTATTDAISTVVAAPPGTPGYLATVRATLPPNTVITAKNADGTSKVLTAPLSFTFTAPADSSATGSGTHGVPVPTGFTTLASTSGAVDVQITGAALATFSNPITITLPVPGKAVGEMIKVYTVSGTTYTLLGIISVRPTGFVSFDVSSLSWKVGNPSPDPAGSTTTAQPTTTTIAATTTTMGTTTVQPTTTTVLALDGVALYAGNCAICHGPLLTPAPGRKIPQNTTVQRIRDLGMAFSLTDAQLLAIIAVLPP